MGFYFLDLQEQMYIVQSKRNKRTDVQESYPNVELYGGGVDRSVLTFS